MPKKKTKKINSPKGKLDLIPSGMDVLEQALNGDKELILFFLCWLKNDRNATKAYRELHPDVDERTAAVLGSRKLRKVDIGLICDSYGIGYIAYFEKLRKGLNATDFEWKSTTIGKGKKAKVIMKQISKPNHAIQKAYHDKLGELLKIEGVKDTTNVAVQVNNLISEKKNDYGI